MQKRQFGESVQKISVKEIESDGKRVPGLGWKVSKQTRREIDEIEDNIRSAEQKSGMLLMG